MEAVKNTRKMKGLILVMAVVLVVAGAIGGTYMWFFNQTDAMSGSGNAAIIDIDGTYTALNFDKVIPGQEVDLSTSTLNYIGNQYAILQITLADATVKTALDGDITAHDDWDAAFVNDYYLDGTIYRFTQARLDEILKITFNLTPGNVQFYNVDNRYYALLAPNSSAINLVSDLKLKFTGEFGGGYQGSDSRQFEQNSDFAGFGIIASVIQVTEEAVMDQWGQQAIDDLNDPALATLMADILAVGSWGYTGA